MTQRHENAIEFYSEDSTATLSLHKKKYVSRIKKLKKLRPEEVDYVENQDGTICAHVPVSWIKINPPRSLSDEYREAARRRVIENPIPRRKGDTKTET